MDFDTLLPRTRVIRLKDIARGLDTSARAIRSAIEAGRLPPPVAKLSRKTWLFDRAAVVEALRRLQGVLAQEEAADQQENRPCR
jgi:hypothetical protein